MDDDLEGRAREREAPSVERGSLLFCPNPSLNIAQINLPPITVKVETTFQPHYEDGNMMIDDWNYDSD